MWDGKALIARVTGMATARPAIGIFHVQAAIFIGEALAAVPITGSAVKPKQVPTVFILGWVRR